MAVNHQNSVGWLALQLAEKQRANDLAVQNQINQERREDNRNSGELAFKVAQHAADQHDAAENRKLTLASLMQRQTEANQTKLTLEQMKELFTKPGVEAKAAKDKAAGHLSDVKAGDIPKDTAIAQSEHDRKVEADKSANEDRDAARAQGAQIAATQAAAKVSPISGDPVLDVNPTAMLPGTAPKAVEASSEGVPLGKTYPKVVEQLGSDKELVTQLRDVNAALADPKLADPSDFGVTGDKVGVGGITPNTLGDLFATPASKRRAALAQRINLPLNSILRRYGAALTETELGRGIGEAGLQSAINGKFSPFATPLDILRPGLAKLLAEAEGKLAVTQEEAQTRRRKTSPRASAAAPGSNEEYTKQLEDRARAQNSAQASSADPEVRRKAIAKEVDEHIKNGELDASDRDAAIEWQMSH